MPKVQTAVTYDYSDLLPLMFKKKWCTARYLEEELCESRAWVINRLWVAVHDGVVEYKEVINKRDRVTYAWRLTL